MKNLIYRPFLLTLITNIILIYGANIPHEYSQVRLVGQIEDHIYYLAKNKNDIYLKRHNMRNDHEKLLCITCAKDFYDSKIINDFNKLTASIIDNEVYISFSHDNNSKSILYNTEENYKIKSIHTDLSNGYIYFIGRNKLIYIPLIKESYFSDYLYTIIELDNHNNITKTEGYYHYSDYSEKESRAINPKINYGARFFIFDSQVMMTFKYASLFISHDFNTDALFYTYEPYGEKFPELSDLQDVSELEGPGTQITDQPDDVDVTQTSPGPLNSPVYALDITANENYAFVLYYGNGISASQVLRFALTEGTTSLDRQDLIELVSESDKIKIYNINKNKFLKSTNIPEKASSIAIYNNYLVYYNEDGFDKVEISKLLFN